jgi:DNA repair protein RecO (recombination protein O)
MSRTLVREVLVLSVRASGEANREATLLSSEEGILRATVFGGPKSKLRAHVAPFHSGTMWLYRDPVRDSIKVTDFDVRSWRPALRELLERSWAGSAVVDTVRSSHGGGGSWPEALALADETLDALELADAEGSAFALLRFLWKWADLLGCRPEMDACGACACRLADDEVVWYFRRETAFRCRRCAFSAGDADTLARFSVSGPARAWLRAADVRDAGSCLSMTMDAAAAAQAKRLSTEVLSEALGRRLASWDGWDAVRR